MAGHKNEVKVDQVEAANLKKTIDSASEVIDEMTTALENQDKAPWYAKVNYKSVALISAGAATGAAVAVLAGASLAVIAMASLASGLATPKVAQVVQNSFDYGNQQWQRFKGFLSSYKTKSISEDSLKEMLGNADAPPAPVHANDVVLDDALKPSAAAAVTPAQALEKAKADAAKAAGQNAKAPVAANEPVAAKPAATANKK